MSDNDSIEEEQKQTKVRGNKTENSRKRYTYNDLVKLINKQQTFIDEMENKIKSCIDDNKTVYKMFYKCNERIDKMGLYCKDMNEKINGL